MDTGGVAAATGRLVELASEGVPEPAQRLVAMFVGGTAQVGAASNAPQGQPQSTRPLVGMERHAMVRLEPAAHTAGVEPACSQVSVFPAPRRVALDLIQ